MKAEEGKNSAKETKKSPRRSQQLGTRTLEVMDALASKTQIFNQQPKKIKATVQVRA
jgi:hypothetical protein